MALLAPATARDRSDAGSSLHPELFRRLKAAANAACAGAKCGSNETACS